MANLIETEYFNGNGDIKIINKMLIGKPVEIILGVQLKKEGIRKAKKAYVVGEILLITESFFDPSDNTSSYTLKDSTGARYSHMEKGEFEASKYIALTSKPFVQNTPKENPAPTVSEGKPLPQNELVGKNVNNPNATKTEPKANENSKPNLQSKFEVGEFYKNNKTAIIVFGTFAIIGTAFYFYNKQN